MTKIYSYPYQQSYIPSMPVVEVTIEAIATNDDELILGRDVLNQLVVTLHGTAEMVEILGRD